jgi:hypothetical protein
MGQSKMDNPEALATLSTRHRRKRKTKHNIENKKISNKDPTKKTSGHEWISNSQLFSGDRQWYR